MRVGFIGAGVIGSAMIRCLLQAGHDVTVYDIQREATTEVCKKGAVWGESPVDIAKLSEAIFTSLPGPKEVEEVMLHPEMGLLVGLRPGSVFIDTSTNSYLSFRRLAEACRSKNVEVLDAPVSRGNPGDSGLPPGVTMMVGGEEQTFKKYRALLGAVSSKVFYLGETGNGMVAKAINQFLICGSFLLGVEAFITGAKAGIDLNTLYQALSVSTAGRSIQLDPFPLVVFKGEFRRGVSPGGPLKRWVKDLNCAREVAESVKAPADFVKTVDEALRSAEAQGLGDSVWYAVVQVMEQMARVELRLPSSV
jgi:3-hydroxyisobutyrate dehydrogenase-like beta-hydroxyacid dehydrogenase